MNELTICKNMRRDILDMTKNSGSFGAHIGGAMSMVEIMYALYLGKNKVDIKKDTVILSKGHAIMAWYSAFHNLGIISNEELLTFKKNETRLYAHPSIGNGLPIEFASGSLGQGLSLGVGVALSKKMRNSEGMTYVILGDGECNEGQIWEAALSASHFNLDNIVVLIDCNKLQYDGDTSEVMNISPLNEKWLSFGFDVVTVDGHSVRDLESALEKKHDNKPLVIIALTVKGKGVSFMENDPQWHNHSLTDEQYKIALEEISSDKN